MDIAFTPADFGLSEGRFKKQFRVLKNGAEAFRSRSTSILPAGERAGKTPFIWSVDDSKRLIKVEVHETLVHLVEERRKNWRTLQYLAGFDVAKHDADHNIELEALRHQYLEAVDQRESSIDSIAKAMSELAASSSAPPAGGLAQALMGTAPQRSGRGGPGCGEGQRRGAALRRGRRRQVQQLQDLLSGTAGAVRKEQGGRRRRDEGGGPPHPRRPRARQGHSGTQEQDRSRRRQL